MAARRSVDRGSDKRLAWVRGRGRGERVLNKGGREVESDIVIFGNLFYSGQYTSYLVSSYVR